MGARGLRPRPPAERLDRTVREDKASRYEQGRFNTMALERQGSDLFVYLLSASEYRQWEAPSLLKGHSDVVRAVSWSPCGRKARWEEAEVRATIQNWMMVMSVMTLVLELLLLMVMVTMAAVMIIMEVVLC
ncbi:hypothetical protein AK812_SmicGene15738 [Symbiodinium microadriaticum]|uniref:Uncharacterized protein n=1 Tax=Symbiodinium microadriaticum TaxID=2951 RepID=A0A1Q9E267_SYMMI|nr:hypothetical protein AK812_SmicGene15738 [Symbiodinium microadriaticum]